MKEKKFNHKKKQYLLRPKLYYLQIKCEKKNLNL